MKVSADVSARESRLLRLYQLDTGDAGGRALQQALILQTSSAPELAAKAFGVDDADPWWLTPVTLSDIGDLGLQAFLAEGHDVPLDQLSAETDRLAACQGTLLIAHSRAFDDAGVTLHPAPFLTPLMMFDAKHDPTTAQPMARAKVNPVQVTPPRTAGSPQKAPSAKWMLAALLLAGMLVLLLALLGGRT